MDLPSLAYRRARGDAIEIYKYLHGNYRIDSSAMLPLHHAAGAETRGNGMKLLKRESHSQLRSNFLGYRAVNMWNGLPEETVKASTVNSFKGHFDRYCRLTVSVSTGRCRDEKGTCNYQI